MSDSTLFLRILAMADYYTSNGTLMRNENVPHVFVDVILDPFILNVLPRSLVSSLVYLGILALGAWALARNVMGWIGAVATEGDAQKKDK